MTTLKFGEATSSQPTTTGVDVAWINLEMPGLAVALFPQDRFSIHFSHVTRARPQKQPDYDLLFRICVRIKLVVYYCTYDIRTNWPIYDQTLLGEESSCHNGGNHWVTSDIPRTSLSPARFLHLRTTGNTSGISTPAHYNPALAHKHDESFNFIAIPPTQSLSHFSLFTKDTTSLPCAHPSKV